MSIKQNKELIRQYCIDYNQLGADVAKIRPLHERYFPAGFVVHSLERGDRNREQSIEFQVSRVSAFPDMKVTIDDMVAEGDKVAVKYTSLGTHKATFVGIPATGKQIVGKGVEIYRISAGKIAEIWVFPDSLGMMTQLGAIPSAAKK